MFHGEPVRRRSVQVRKIRLTLACVFTSHTDLSAAGRRAGLKRELPAILLNAAGSKHIRNLSTDYLLLSLFSILSMARRAAPFNLPSFSIFSLC